MAARWQAAFPKCIKCERHLVFMLDVGTWDCVVHGDMFSGQALAVVRGYRR